MPPAPITRARPNCGSFLRPMMSSATAPVTMRSTRTSGASFAIFWATASASSTDLMLRATPPASVLWAMAEDEVLMVTGKPKLLCNACGLGCFADAPFGHGKAEIFQENLGIMFAQHDFAFAGYGRCGQRRQRFVAGPVPADEGGGFESGQRVIKAHHGGNAVGRQIGGNLGEHAFGKRGGDNGARAGDFGRFGIGLCRDDPGGGIASRMGWRIRGSARRHQSRRAARRNRLRSNCRTGPR